MRIVKSFVGGKWFTPPQAEARLIDPCTEEVLGGVSSQGLDFGAALGFARERGGPDAPVSADRVRRARDILYNEGLPGTITD